MIKCATFRFYEELNDFLPSAKRKVDFSYTFKGTPSIKDTIEKLGVPHVEVDLILVNGDVVDFKYLLKNGDRVSVYPVFETFNLEGVSHLRDKPLRESRFILDVHLGKLAKFLRLFGFDTLYKNDFEDRTIIDISLSERRIILTRDLGILKVKSVTHGYFIRSQDPKKQLQEVLHYFDLYQSIRPFSRCVYCNRQLDQVEKLTIVHELEPLTIKYYDRFFRCSDCLHLFWEGSHYERMKQFIESIRIKKSL
jgi:uncharacterized protein